MQATSGIRQYLYGYTSDILSSVMGPCRQLPRVIT